MDNLKYTIVTGSSEGFGKALAFECARRRMNLILVALPGSGLIHLANYLKRNYEIEIVCFEADLSVEDNCIAFYEEIAKMQLRVNMLINNAGIGGTNLFSRASIRYYQKQIKLNVLATTLITHLFLENLRENGPSYILNVGSMSSFFFLIKKQVYGGTKSFIYSFSKSLAMEVKHEGIQVSVICPGGMNTNLSVTMMVKSANWFTRMTVMNPEKVASIAIESLLNGEEVIIPGRINQFLLFLDKILPAAIKNIITKYQMSKLESATVGIQRASHVEKKDNVLLTA